MTNFEQRYADLGAQLHGGAPVRRTPLPPPTIPQPAQPTATLTVDGIALEPAARLTALAAVRDGHRGRARSASERMHQLRELIEERRIRVRMIEQRIGPMGDERAEGEISQINAELEQLIAARDACNSETQEATEAAGAAQQVLRAAIKFAVDAGATVPVLLIAEVSK